ncbi:toll-like receptor 12 [Acomys russatus]|uniref:toll-like receptor 12 n=1 Tax=Acomys russatus TaxID=60746 RepID=UPI0021E2DC04|nr:toll-like receptor 12 [Acomys russatus]
MGRYSLLAGLLLSLPLVAGWTTSKCLLTEGSRLPLVSRYFSFCADSKLAFLAACIPVTNLTQTLEAVPQSVEGLCLSGSVSTLHADAFSAFPGLKILALNLHLTRLLPRAFQGLGQLQKLSFLEQPFRKRSLVLPPDAFGDLISLQRLHISGYCLDKKAGVQLPPSLQWLSVKFSCLQDVGELAGMFPDLVQNSSSRTPWALRMLDLSFNQGLKMASPGSLQGLQLEALNLERTGLEAEAVRALGLQKLDVLSAWTATAELPAEAVAHFRLQGLNVGNTKLGYISQEALASCSSLETLGLQATGLTKLPPGFLAAMPRLQRLNLASNQLQSNTLCMNETGDVSGLETLNLAGNGLRTLPPATFSCLPHLRELLLQGNRLLSLEGQLFRDLQQLETLNLDKNPLLNLGGNWLAALPALTTLSLLDTQISTSPTPGFWGAKNLRTLRLKLPLPAHSAPAVLPLPMHLTSLELQAASGGKHWRLSPTVFPFLATLTVEGRGLKLDILNASEVFPALQQLSVLQNSLDAFCSQDTSNIFLWQLPKLQSLKIWGAGSNSRPCLITGLPSLRELRLESLQSTSQPRSVGLEELVGELPQLQALQLSHTGLTSLSATAFQRLRSLRVLVLYTEEDLVLHDSLREYSPQMPQYIYILQSNLACQCANAWIEPWVKQSTKTYVHIVGRHLCPAEVGGPAKHSFYSFLWDHCPQTLELKLFLASSALVFLLLALPLLQEARNSWIPYLQALVRVWLRGLRVQGNEGKRFLFDVFVSHCREDQGWVIEELLPALEGFLPAGLGLRLCLPERDFEPGKDVVDNVVDSMVSSPVTLCVLSGRALCNSRCCLELRVATSLLLAAPFPPTLLLVFLEPISRHQLPGYHRLARLLRRRDYCLWPEEDERKSGFWAWLRSRLGQPGVLK